MAPRNRQQHITMATRKSARISKKPSQPVHNTKVDRHGPGQGKPRGGGGMPCRGGGGGVCRGSGKRGQTSRPFIIKPHSSSSTSTKCNSNEVEEIKAVANSTETKVDDLKASLGATCEEVSSYKRSVTNVLCTLFSVLTAVQIEQIEKSTNEILKEDNLYIPSA